MTKEQATDFFAEFYNGAHHIPGEIKSWGNGFTVNHRSDLSTFDFNALTRLVVLAHDRCVRVSILPCSPQYVRICIHPRTREGSFVHRHPELEEHIDSIRGKEHRKLDLVGLLRDCWSSAWSEPDLTKGQREFELFLKRKNIPFDNQ